jgi:biopolymer transport protein ExbB
VIVERWRSLNDAQVDVDSFLYTIEGMLKDGDRQRALTYCDSVDKPLSRILTAGIRRLGRSLHDIEDAIHNAGKKEIFHLEKRMSWLATISAVAPLIGFTGTVTGLIKAFMAIQNLQGNVNPSVLAGGVWEALVTTAAGLLVGIIALGFYNFLLGKINRMVFELENASTDFMELLQAPSVKKDKKQMV